MSEEREAPKARETRRSTRAGGREFALWMLCHLDGYPAEERWDALELFSREPPALESGDPFAGEAAGEWQVWLADSALRSFARRLVEAWLARAGEYDQIIEARSQRWRVARMDIVDRNILRLAAVELAGEKTPRAVVVAEAVRLAARYGSERSPSFVNGIAEALAKHLRDERDSGAEADPP